jgi:hypothetical protein
LRLLLAFRLAVPRSASLVDPALRRERPTANIVDFPGGLVHAFPGSYPFKAKI